MTDVSGQLVHATCVALDTVAGDGSASLPATGPVGILLRGPPGAGKSDLALRLIDQGGRLVADDQCELHRLEGAAGACLMARAPANIAGALEVRGLGILPIPALAQARVGLVVDLVAPEQIERLPEAAHETILGLDVPRIALHAFEAAALAKLRLALSFRSGVELFSDSPPGSIAKDKTLSEKTQIHRKDGDARAVVLVTGLSGAGRSTTLKILEDMGYEAVDNLPLNLLDSMIAEGGPVALGPVALGIDTRTRNFAVQAILDQLDRFAADLNLEITLLFLDCEDQILERRFTETRRRHPMAQDRRVADGIAAERLLVAPLRARADITVDTSGLSPSGLSRVLAGHLGLEAGPGMEIFVTSFSYRHGLPREADLVIDVRFLDNPHYQPALRDLDGRDPRVAAHIEADPAFEDFFAKLAGMIGPLLPRYEQEGKSYLTIAVGCTGGQHRSVAVAEKLNNWLNELSVRVNLSHRDIGSRHAPGIEQA